MYTLMMIPCDKCYRGYAHGAWGIQEREPFLGCWWRLLGNTIWAGLLRMGKGTDSQHKNLSKRSASQMPGLIKKNEGTETKVKCKFNELMELDEWTHSVFWLLYHCIKCTGLTMKAHFTFETSQEKLQYYRLITVLLLSQQLPPRFPATNLLLQTR